MRSGFVIVCLLLSAFAWAQVDSTPLVDGVGVDEHLGEHVDLDLRFRSERGQPVSLRDYMEPGRPVILAPVYYSCPRMCTLVLNGVRDLIRDLDMQPGTDYQVINISFDPTNTPDMAAAKAHSYIESLKPKIIGDNWHFLTGDSDQVEKVMDQIGFRYKWINDAYSHASVIVFLSDTGKITRYLYGVTYPVRDARLALLEASQGKVGSTLDRILIYCFHYDPLTGKYTLAAMNIMRAGGVFAAFAFAVLGYFLVKRPSRKRRMELHG